MGRGEPDSGKTGEEGTLRYVVVVAAVAVGLAVHDALSGSPPTTRWITAACSAVTVGGVGLALLNRWLASSGPAVDADGLLVDARHEQIRLEVNRLTHAQARDAVLDKIGRDAGNGQVPEGAPKEVRELACHATWVSAGLWDIELARVYQADADMGLPAGWIVGDDGTGHTMLIVQPDGRAVAVSDDDPDDGAGEQYPSLWHGLLVAIREDEQ